MVDMLLAFPVSDLVVKLDEEFQPGRVEIRSMLVFWNLNLNLELELELALALELELHFDIATFSVSLSLYHSSTRGLIRYLSIRN